MNQELKIENEENNEMPSVNRVLLVGLIWTKPVISKTRTGVLMANFEVTTQHRNVDDAGVETTVLQRHPCRAYGGLAELAERSLLARGQVLIEGRLQTHHNVGAARGDTVIIAGTLLPITSPAEQLKNGDHQAVTPQPALTPRSYSEEGI